MIQTLHINSLPTHFGIKQHQFNLQWDQYHILETWPMRSTLGIGLLKGILLHGCHLHLCETVRTPTPKKIEKEWIKWLFQRKSLKINQRIGFCHFGFFGTFLTTFSLELLYELVDSMSTSFQSIKSKTKRQNNSHHNDIDHNFA